jgi:hypothetical protein
MVPVSQYLMHPLLTSALIIKRGGGGGGGGGGDDGDCGRGPNGPLTH